MVKRLRRSPLTAETGVRFPVGVPKQKDGQIDRPFVLLFPLEYEHRRGSDDFDGQTMIG